MGRIERAMIAVVSALVSGFVGTLLIAQVAAGRSDTVGATLAAIGGIGALCAIIGTAADSRPEALLAGSVGVFVAVAQLPGSDSSALGTALILTILALPYLAGFGVVTLVNYVLEGEP